MGITSLRMDVCTLVQIHSEEVEMTQYREILRLTALGCSQREICASARVSQKTVVKIQKRASELGLAWPLDDSVTDGSLEQKLFPKEQAVSTKRMPDYEYIRKELLRNGVNKKLLWTEYLEDCKRTGDNPLMYSQFCHYIQENEEKRRATMHIPRKPGEQIEVDWAGDPAKIIDPDTGELVDAWIFIGVMSYSQYTFAEAFLNERQHAWITAHVHMYEFFGGISKILVPDNASTAVNHKKYDWYSPELIRSYGELAEHYNTAIIPARIRHPKDKPHAEGSVCNASTWITAALRNEQFFSLVELNAGIREKLERLNTKPFQKKEGSRSSSFFGEEKYLLSPLPATRYELASWSQPTVQFNYHVEVDRMFYSVPFQYINNDVEVRLTEHTVEVFLKKSHERIASHKRLFGRPGQYSTIPEHMPKDHQQYLAWDGDRFKRWARQSGENTYAVIDYILSNAKIEQQAYRSCMGIMRLADKHSKAKLESACRKAMECSGRPSYKSIKDLIATLRPEDIAIEEKREDQSVKRNPFSLVRGAKYYGGGRNADE
jgi:transposase